MGRCEALLVLGYTYNRKNTSRNNLSRWYCTRYHQGCKAAVITMDDLTVVTHIGTHTHTAPRLICTADQRYHATNVSKMIHVTRKQ
ncbi:unnamed protein product [Chrysodeixis includens]|uniref:FLYWCH-type domain-containing protein n=1 Tax=Chrysodeixis includens TaxID=689277 RepID=A0A9N8KSS9_CHRIL|nr:unnamed protein product [Chrysodeixis includens]